MKQFHGDMKMADLIEVNYHLLAVLTRFGIEGGFGEKSVRDICEKNHLDTDTFLLICNVYTRKEYEPSEDILRDGHIDDILRYLHQSHDYYMNNALVLLASTIEDLIEPCSEAQKRVISMHDHYLNKSALYNMNLAVSHNLGIHCCQN